MKKHKFNNIMNLHLVLQVGISFFIFKDQRNES